MDEQLRRDLITMKVEEQRLEADLAEGGSRFFGYNTSLQELHERHAKTLDAIMRKDGWPGRARVGNDGAEAAWLIAQHAIGWPDFQRRCLALLEQAAEIDDVPRWQPAYLIDRIRTMEGREQVYGTQFDWDEKGELSPNPIENPSEVDARRATVGLRPLAPTLAARREKFAQSGETPPKFSAERQQDFLEWARKAGWR